MGGGALWLRGPWREPAWWAQADRHPRLGTTASPPAPCHRMPLHPLCPWRRFPSGTPPGLSAGQKRFSLSGWEGPAEPGVSSVCGGSGSESGPVCAPRGSPRDKGPSQGWGAGTSPPSWTEARFLQVPPPLGTRSSADRVRRQAPAGQGESPGLGAGTWPHAAAGAGQQEASVGARTVTLSSRARCGQGSSAWPTWGSVSSAFPVTRVRTGSRDPSGTEAAADPGGKLSMGACGGRRRPGVRMREAAGAFVG